tara:strand:+ start:310 stop:486 length:177 start_codon:yes stop_codon:yes gene_type:complete
MKGKHYTTNKEEHYEWLIYFSNYILENYTEISDEAEEQADLHMETMYKFRNKIYPFNK